MGEPMEPAGESRELTPLERARQILAEPEVAAVVAAELADRAAGAVPDAQASERLAPAVNLDGTEDDHDCEYRRMLRDVGEWLGVETDAQGRYSAQQIRSRILAVAASDTGQAREPHWLEIERDRERERMHELLRERVANALQILNTATGLAAEHVIRQYLNEMRALLDYPRPSRNTV